MSNIKIIKLLSILSFIFGVIIVTFFYNLSSNLKHAYLDIKNEYAKDNKYLAVITENGIWIKDEINDQVNIINAERLIDNKLINVDIVQFDTNFNFLQNISSKESFYKKQDWKINKAFISSDTRNTELLKSVILKTN